MDMELVFPEFLFLYKGLYFYIGQPRPVWLTGKNSCTECYTSFKFVMDQKMLQS